MIDEEATFEMFGYRSTDLARTSNKKVVAVCEGEGCKNPVRVMMMKDYHDLCHSCSMKSKKTRAKLREAQLIAQNRPEVKAKISEAQKKAWEDPNIRAKHVESAKIMWEDPDVRAKYVKAWEIKTPKEYEDFAIQISCDHQGIPIEDFDGFIGNDRSHVKPIVQCVQMNKRFKGSDAHHIMPSIVIFIPSELHQHIPHNLKTGYNMGEMNILALQFINGGL